MSLSVFPPEFSFEHTAEVKFSTNMNTVCETPLFFPPLEGTSASIPTSEEVEQLSFFDQWLANDCQGSAFNSSEELISTLGDFEIVPYGDSTGLSAESLDAFNVPLIDSSMFSDFPSPASHSQYDFLSEFPETNLPTPCESMMSPAYSHFLGTHSPVNIQLPSPVQTPTMSPIPFKEVSLLPLARSEAEPLCTGSNKRAYSEDISEDVTAKRKRNTEAARRSRQRKVQRLNELDKRTEELLAENTCLSTKIAILESEKEHQRQKDLELRIRIQTLENQLSEAHRLLTER
ncbi:hypothetical protein K493DRAFT_314906 [Basidiobolus meristosporus CBS 931.73]|uniref:BZIP domain-containing protein n=1 Tax=Basidiobolus meristosporus CBS 931.73 TaxID=1314790 RepID=A0A1Y1YCC8_9FUNG|nr:hypothetical protein K493DRAFT_314906 [Basidiobolus meristosporus CBS 931.73]|eukprot:ORX95637.1 hypothetical protein K493DRAFT_314906 [Basidiobolus meristosporus CBS 931.73]